PRRRAGRRERAPGAGCDPRRARKARSVIGYRNAEAQDAAVLAAFARDTFVETFGHLYPPEDLPAYVAQKYTPEALRPQIAHAETHYRLAFEGEALIGYCKIGGPFDLPVERGLDAIELHRLYVHDRAKGAGVAQALMDEALAWARARGAAHVYLSVWEDNH